MAIFKKPTDYAPEPKSAPPTGAGPDMFDVGEPAAATPDLTPAEQHAVAEISAAAAPSVDAETEAPAWDNIEAWSQAVLVGDENAPSFFKIPRSMESPFNGYYFTWANQNALNLQRKTAIGWRLVPPEVCKRLGLSPYQLDARGFASVYDAVLMFIPRKPIDEYFAHKRSEEITNIRDIPEVQEFLEAGRGGIKGVRTFAGDADETREESSFRMNRPIRVRVPRQIRPYPARAREE